MGIAKAKLDTVYAERTASSASTSSSPSPSLTIHLHRGNFKELGAVLRKLGLFGKVDGVLLDLGMSSIQLDSADRGFSFQRDAPLDMRMNPESALTADTIVNTWDETEIGRIIREYGEDNQWKLLARRICMYRENTPIATTHQLVRPRSLLCIICPTFEYTLITMPNPILSTSSSFRARNCTA